MGLLLVIYLLKDVQSKRRLIQYEVLAELELELESETVIQGRPRLTFRLPFEWYMYVYTTKSLFSLFSSSFDRRILPLAGVHYTPSRPSQPHPPPSKATVCSPGNASSPYIFWILWILYLFLCFFFVREEWSYLQIGGRGLLNCCFGWMWCCFCKQGVDFWSSFAVESFWQQVCFFKKKKMKKLLLE